MNCKITNWPIYSEGYGQKTVEGKSLLSHREAYRESFGEIPEGFCVLHKCDNRACVNPAHLFLGSRGDNCRDMVSKNRQAKGVVHGKSCVNELKACAVMAQILQGKRSAATASNLGISPAVVSGIKTGRTWNWVFNLEAM